MAQRKRPIDLFFAGWFGICAFAALVMEPFIVFRLDFTGPFGGAWSFYARHWDPLFLDAPAWLRLISGFDEFVYGPFYLITAYAFARGREWIRFPFFLFTSAITFSTTFYLLMEFFTESRRANLWMVVLINGPYMVVPLLAAVRLRKPRPFAIEEKSHEHRDRAGQLA